VNYQPGVLCAPDLTAGYLKRAGGCRAIREYRSVSQDSEGKDPWLPIIDFELVSPIVFVQNDGRIDQCCRAAKLNADQQN
jgi:hypothetical protein